MRRVYKKFADGTYKVYETDETGRNQRILDGDVPDDKKVRRVSVYIELSCDDERVVDARQGLDQIKRNLPQ